MNSRLKEVAKEGNIKAFYALVREDNKLLEDVEKASFVDTPMHTAAAAGHTTFVMEMFNLMPSFAKKLNKDGYSPMHLALQKEKFELVLRLVYHDPDLIRVKGRNGKSLLHTVAKKGNCDLLYKFLCACPDSVQDLTSRGQTVVHVATKNRKPDAVELIVGWLLYPFYKELEMEKILNWRDNDGNAAIHLAITTGQVPVVRSLVAGGIYSNVVNSHGRTALEMLSNQPNTDDDLEMLAEIGAREKILTSFGYNRINSKMSFFRRLIFSIMREINSIPAATSSVFVVVCILLASTAYQTAVRPPTSIAQMEQYDHTAVLEDKTASIYNTATTPFNVSSSHYHAQALRLQNPLSFYLFTSLNTMAFYVCMMFILLLVPFPHGRFTFYAFISSLYMIVACYLMTLIAASGSLILFVLILIYSSPFPYAIYSFHSRRDIYFQQIMQYIVTAETEIHRGRGRL